MSLSTVIWNNTDTRQCRILQAQTHRQAVILNTDPNPPSISHFAVLTDLWLRLRLRPILRWDIKRREFSYPAWRKRDSQSLENWSGISGLRNGSKPHTSSIQATWRRKKKSGEKQSALQIHCHPVEENDSDEFSLKSCCSTTGCSGTTGQLTEQWPPEQSWRSEFKPQPELEQYFKFKCSF